MSIILTLIYITLVAYSYVFSLHFHALKGYRNDPIIMKFRIKRILIVSVINLALAPIILIYIIKTVPDLSSLIEILGFRNIFKIKNFFNMLKTLYLFMILFSGPLMDEIFNPKLFHNYLTNLEIFRDLIIAPFTEELFYTSLTTGPILAWELSQQTNQTQYLPTLFYDSKSINSYLKVTPLLFGFAHLHHAVEMKRSGFKIFKIIITCGFQCIYTTLFGYLTNRIFINSGSVWCCFIAHSFCNFMGLPKLDASGCLSYRITYWSLLIIGIFYFSLNFTKLTYSSN